MMRVYTRLGQQMILDLVNRFGAIREDQAKGILKHMYPGAVYEKTVFPLVTGRKIKQSNGYLFSKSGKLDEKIITAIDIMLILGFELKEPIIKGTEPFALTFFRKREEKLWRYDICPVSYGTEAAVSALLENINVKYRMLIFVPEKEEQMQGIRVPCDHCYVIKNDGNYEFYLYSKEGEE